MQKQYFAQDTVSDSAVVLTTFLAPDGHQSQPAQYLARLAMLGSKAVKRRQHGLALAGYH